MDIKESWKKILPYSEWKKIQTKINPSQVYPRKDLLFKAFSYCEIDQIHTVIMGNAPTTELSFGFKEWGYDNIIADALASDLNNIAVERFLDPSLIKWAKEGVLLTNAALTSPRLGDTRAHLNLWKNFTASYIEALDKKDRNFVFLTKDALKYSVLIKKGSIIPFKGMFKKIQYKWLNDDVI